MPAAFLRRLGEAAGVHSYLSAEDVVWAARGILSVSVKDAGDRTIRLLQASDVRDLFSGETVATGVTQFTASFAERQSRCFGIAPSRR